MEKLQSIVTEINNSSTIMVTEKSNVNYKDLLFVRYGLKSRRVSFFFCVFFCAKSHFFFFFFFFMKRVRKQKHASNTQKESKLKNSKK